MIDRWLLPLRTGTAPRLSIVAFHYAGGSAQVFSKWTSQLPADCDLWAVQLPGRWERSGEPLAGHIDELVAPLAQIIREKISGSFFFVGYSLGGLVAYEVAQRLQSSGGPLPLHLLVLSKGPPQIHQNGPRLTQLPDPRFLEELQSKYGGIPSWLVNDPEMLAVFLPTLRADIALIETYRTPITVRLRFPVTAWGGVGDLGLPLENLKRWEETTEGPFTCLQFEGTHFFAESNRAAFFAELNRLLTNY